ncbi:hypothetical protein QR680_001992 [Steinernema hermaphroditum]|uniref:Uncharacterized protein n=1 Tax=Steinernema hermaphroditum TaxID=289476 RepID=A0AA39H3K7_9BILA|nr:hypothetical protein QR680_001992 [Steinernema hermaphroditum]
MPTITIQENGIPLNSQYFNSSTVPASARGSHDLPHSYAGGLLKQNGWPSREEFERNLRKVLLIAPFTRHRCCLGCIALDDAVLLICVFQLIQLAIVSLLGAQLAVSNGYLFYTTALEGRGSQIAYTTAVFVLISVFVVCVTLYAWANHKPRLYFFHIVWQIVIVCVIVGTIKIVFTHIKSSSSSVPEEFQIVWPSAFVIIFFFSIAALIQIWWVAVMVDAYFNQYTKTEHLGRTIAIVVPGLLRYPRASHQFADEVPVEVPMSYAI